MPDLRSLCQHVGRRCFGAKQCITVGHAFHFLDAHCFADKRGGGRYLFLVTERGPEDPRR